MNNCIRCGTKLAHNYLKIIVMTINEKRRRVLACSRCQEILDEKNKKIPLVNQDSKGEKKESKKEEVREVKNVKEDKKEKVEAGEKVGSKVDK